MNFKSMETEEKQLLETIIIRLQVCWYAPSDHFQPEQSKSLEQTNRHLHNTHLFYHNEKQKSPCLSNQKF